ncbi:MAG: DUF2513 domain-containing protein [Acidobacteria bacterium]|nr:DUF2513 domain-containing protein [Acidobacteriota bacterium]
MKRNMDLVRALLLDVEANQLLSNGRFRLEATGYSRQDISDHLALMRQGGLVWQEQLARFVTATGEESGSVPAALTWHGHEFLDQIRSEDVWGRVKEHALRVSGGLSLEVIKFFIPEVLRQLIKQ